MDLNTLKTLGRQDALKKLGVLLPLLAGAAVGAGVMGGAKKLFGSGTKPPATPGMPQQGQPPQMPQMPQ